MMGAKRGLVGLAALAMAGIALPGPASANEWVTVDTQGCRMWNPFPEHNESFTWTGTCVNGHAEGSGTVVEKTGDGAIHTIGYGTWVAGKLHGDYYYEKEGRTCYEQKFFGVARHTMCIDSAGAVTIRSLDDTGRAMEAMRPMTGEEKDLYKVIHETITSRRYVAKGG